MVCIHTQHTQTAARPAATVRKCQQVLVAQQAARLLNELCVTSYKMDPGSLALQATSYVILRVM